MRGVRKAAVLETMLNLDADLLSLVELDEFDDHFNGVVRKGYDAVWKKQLSSASSADDCAIVYRRGSSPWSRRTPSSSSTNSATGA